MSFSFIQVQQSVVSHRKTLRLARLLNLDRYAVVGRLVALWSWCPAQSGLVIERTQKRIQKRIQKRAEKGGAA